MDEERGRRRRDGEKEGKKEDGSEEERMGKHEREVDSIRG